MAAIAKRAYHTEKALENQHWGLAAVKSAQPALEQDFTPLSDFRASSQYRMQVAKNVLHKLLIETPQVTDKSDELTAKTRISDYV